MTPFTPMDFTFNAAALQPRPNEPFVEYWMSLSPMAPMFGIEWRFAQVMGAPVTEKPKVKAKAKPKAAPKPVEDAVIVETPKAAPVAAVAPANTPAKADAPTKAEAPKPTPRKSQAKPAAPKPMPTPAPAKTGIEAVLMDKAPAGGSDLSEIKGIGPKLATELNGMGLYTVEQISRLAEKDLAWIDERLSAFKGRSLRDDWIGQAKTLTGG